MEKVSVVLNVYKRSQNFSAQIESLKAQTVPPFEILVWENGEESIANVAPPGVLIARANSNLGVWSRFAFALNATGEYILILDDDTIPGIRWIENCLKTIQIHPGLLGTRGLRFTSVHSYAGYSEVGLYSPNDAVERVDIVGHAWFFRRELLGAFWGLYQERFKGSLSGEDIHFSFAIQKVLNLGTFVPPHPKDDIEMWGSNPDLALRLGSDEVAISRASDSFEKFEKAFNHYISKGFNLVIDSESPPEGAYRMSSVVAFLIGKLPRLAALLAGSRLGEKLRRIFISRT